MSEAGPGREGDSGSNAPAAGVDARASGPDRIVSGLEAVGRRIGQAVRWLALAMLALQFAVVLLRYVFGISFVYLQEGMIYLHAALFMLGAGYTLVVDQHVRVDIFYSRLGQRGRAVIDLLGTLLLLLPSMVVILFVSWPFVRNSWAVLEGPISVGGIPASFLLKSLIPLFCLLLILQGLAIALATGLRLLRTAGEGSGAAS